MFPGHSRVGLTSDFTLRAFHTNQQTEERHVDITRTLGKHWSTLSHPDPVAGQQQQ